MSPEQKRKFNTIAGTFLSLGSVVFLALTIYFVLVPRAPKPHPVEGTPIVGTETCGNYLRRMQFNVEPTNPESKEMVVHGELKEELDMVASELFLDKISYATTICGYQLNKFCMGTACSEGKGIHFSLAIPSKMVDKKITKPKSTDARASAASEGGKK